MAQPSSSHREHGDRDRHRSDRSSHRHHRTISSTTLLLVLSLVLAVLAVMLSLPSQQAAAAANATADPASTGLLGYLAPKRSQALVARESSVAMREADVARREAELLVGAPGGVVPTTSPILCPACPSMTIETVTAPAQTIIKEIVKEESLTPPGWTGNRAEELLDRELKITERERDISKREESVNRREHDASRRESWIMEQLISLGNDNPHTVEEEYVYEPAGAKRKPKFQELPPLIVSETSYETQTVTATQTVTVPAPANTRLAAFPTPQAVSSSSTTASPRTTAVEIVTEEDLDPASGDVEGRPRTVTVKRGANPTRRPPARWFGGW